MWAVMCSSGKHIEHIDLFCYTNSENVKLQDFIAGD